LSRYLILEVEPAEYSARIAERYVATIRELAGIDAVGNPIEVVANYGGRVVVKVPNGLLNYARAAAVILRKVDDAKVGILTLRVAGTRRKAMAIAASLKRISSS
jgi:RNase P/RNase MRP subunit POP5